ncbi:hypothetical protein Are01nite_73920 [Actinoplanes regularis]|nr:hypothetical protein Are01nite_73920 [Actinoplanes regularis]
MIRATAGGAEAVTVCHHRKWARGRQTGQQKADRADQNGGGRAEPRSQQSAAKPSQAIRPSGHWDPYGAIARAADPRPPVDELPFTSAMRFESDCRAGG